MEMLGIMLQAMRTQLSAVRGERGDTRELVNETVELLGNVSDLPPQARIAVLANQVFLQLKDSDPATARAKMDELARMAAQALEPGDPMLLAVQAMYAECLAIEDASAIGALREIHSTLAKDHGTDDLITQAAENSLATALGWAGHYEEAMSILRSVLERREQNGSAADTLGLFSVKQAAELLWRQGRYQECLDTIKEFFDVCETVRASAGDAFQRATQAEQLGVTEMSVLAAICLRLLDSDPAEGLRMIERGAARSLMDVLAQDGNDVMDLARQSRDGGWWSPDRFAAFCEVWNSASMAREVVDRITVGEDKARALEALKVLRARERMLRPFLAELTPISSLRSASEIRDHLRQGEVLLVYAESRSACTLVAISPTGAMLAEIVADLGSHDQFTADVKASKSLLRLGAKPDIAKDNLARLCDRLFPKDVRLLVSAARSITVVANGETRTLPLDYIAESGGLVEFSGKPIQYVPSASGLVYLRQRGNRRGNSSKMVNISLVGDVYYGEMTWSSTRFLELASDMETRRVKRSHHQLPWTALEVADLQMIANSPTMSDQPPQVRVLTGRDAYLQAVREKVTGVDLALFATHGCQGSDNDPSSAYLLFAPANNACEPERLTLRELVKDWGNRLNRCRVVALSACSSDAPVDVGGNAWALTLGFLHAGAQCVLASVTPVVDLAGWLFVRRFFENLTGAFGSDRPTIEEEDYSNVIRPGHPASPAVALVEAKQWIRRMSTAQLMRELKRRRPGMRADFSRSNDYRQLLERCRMTSTPFEHPCHWAGYRIVGDGI